MVNSGLKFQALEPRIMFDGAAVFTGAEALEQLENQNTSQIQNDINSCLLYTSPSPRDFEASRMPSSA